MSTGNSNRTDAAATTTQKSRRSTKTAKSDANGEQPTTSFRYSETRPNNPSATLAAEGSSPVKGRVTYAYNPHRPPTLVPALDLAAAQTADKNLDATEQCVALIRESKTRTLNPDEAERLERLLRAAILTQQPHLQWAGKAEAGPTVSVDPVALHLHERVSAQAILATAARKDVERSLFADPELPYHEAVQFYQHPVRWANRLILGDSLPVMSSLAEREDLAGRVQMIYMDPPYGIKFASNFQPQIGKRDVKDHPDDLTREIEQVKAFRDTWSLGIHSYLTYLRDRLVAARKLLTDTGSIFVQISDENLHRVRQLLDEVFGPENFVAEIVFSKTSGATNDFIPSTADFLLWYARKKSELKYNEVFDLKVPEDEAAGPYSWIETTAGQRYRPSTEERPELIAGGARMFRLDNLQSQSIGREKGHGAACWFPIPVDGREWLPGNQSRWKTNEQGMSRLLKADRVGASGGAYYIRYLDDFPVKTINNLWGDTGVAGFASNKMYVVETSTKVIERCLLMTTDPGDLVLDPTCGSGTTAYVAEHWGRRWITCDTSRVAVAIARQRLMTAKFDRFRVRGEDDVSASKSNGTGVDPHPNFVYRTVPHVTLKSIAQNVALDPVFAKHQPVLDGALTGCNAALATVDTETRTRLSAKLFAKQRDEGKRAITDADRRRWELPKAFEHWTVPFDADPLYPKALADAVTAYRAAWRAKMDEVNRVIAAGAEPEVLVDQPEKVKGVIRVSGPFTVEAVQPPETMLGDELPVVGFDGAPAEVGATFIAVEQTGISGSVNGPQEAAIYLENMVRLLRQDGVRFLNNKQATFARLDAIFDTKDGLGFHAEGNWSGSDDGGPARVGVVFGPQYGPVTAKMIEELIRPAGRRYEELVIAGFSFDAAAQQIIANPSHPKLRIHQANISPDINPAMNDLLKQKPNSHLFTVFGQPRVTVDGPDVDGRFTVTMEGVDVYDPVNDVVSDTGADKVAAWFLDGDYDGQAFCTTQAFFPDRGAWEKLAKSLGTSANADAFAAFAGTTSLPFAAGKHERCAVKVIDPRGNEVMSVHTLSAAKKGR